MRQQTKYRLWISLLIMVNLASALSVIYAVDWHRRLVSQKHELITRQQFLQSQRNQLLLEYSSLTSPIRIQNMAQKRFNMRQPPSNQSHIIYDQKSQTTR